MQNSVSIVIANLATAEKYFDHFECEMHTDNSGANRVAIKNATGAWNSGTSRFEQSHIVVFTNAINGTTYWFRFRVIDKYGNPGAWSTFISEVGGDSTAPSPTYGSVAVSATPGGIYVKLNPVSPATDNDRYELFVRLNSSTTPIATDVPTYASVDGNFHVGMANADTANLWARGVDTSGNKQVWVSLGGFTSNGAGVLAPPSTTPGAPTSFSMTAGAGHFSFTWAPPAGATSVTLLSYTVEVATNAGFSTGVVDYPNLTTNSLHIRVPSTTYFARIKCTYPNSAFSAWANFGAPTSAASGLVAVGTDTSGNLDNLPDGATYGRPIVGRLSGGKPWIDFSEGIHSNKNLDNLADGSSRFGVINGGGLKAVASVDGANKALIDFSQGGHTNKTLDNVADGTRVAWVSATQKNAAVDVNGNLLLKNIGSVVGATSGPTTASTVYSVVPEMTQTLTFKGNKTILLFTCGYTPPGSLQTGSFAFFKDGVQLSQDYQYVINATDLTIALTLLDTPSAASHTYDIRWKVTAGGSMGAIGTARTLQIVELG